MFVSRCLDILSEDENPYLGSLNFNNREVGVFGGFGDMQTALYGSSLREGQIGVNIGTGSQIAQISSNIPDKRKKIDLKPFFKVYQFNHTYSCWKKF